MNSVKTFLRMIKVEHSLFALPFAFTGAVLAAGGIPSLSKLFWIVVAMVGGRSFAMGVNRLVDAEIDSKNPRTSGREIPTGKISTLSAVFFIIISLIVFEFSTFMLNKLSFILSPVPVIIFIVYSYSKRFTYYCHIILGAALGLAPVGAWIAVNGSVNFAIILLGIAVLFWVAGFDIVYALQDIDFDSDYGLFSIPAKVGVRNAIYLSRIFHFVTFFIFFILMFYFDLGIIYLIGVILSGIFMFYEHYLIRAEDLKNVNMAFFNYNAYISITIFVSVLMDIMLRGIF